jgi:hypothetical protein
MKIFSRLVAVYGEFCISYSYTRRPVHVTPLSMKMRNSAARCKRRVARISSRWELQILPPYQLGIVSALEATHDEMAPTDILVTEVLKPLVER